MIEIVTQRYSREIGCEDFFDVAGTMNLSFLDWELEVLAVKLKEGLNGDFRDEIDFFCGGNDERLSGCPMRIACRIARKEGRIKFSEKMVCSPRCDFLAMTEDQQKKLNKKRSGVEIERVVEKGLRISDFRNGNGGVRKNDSQILADKITNLPSGSFKNQEGEGRETVASSKTNRVLEDSLGKSEQVVMKTETTNPVTSEARAKPLSVEKDEGFGRENEINKPKKRKQKTGYILKVGEEEGPLRCIHHFKAFTEADKRRLEEVEKKSGVDVCLIAVYPDGTRKEVSGWVGYVERRNSSGKTARQASCAEKSQKKDVTENFPSKIPAEENEKKLCQKPPLVISSADLSEKTNGAILQIPQDVTMMSGDVQREFNPETFFSRAFLIANQAELGQVKDSPSGFFLCWLGDQWGGRTFIGGASKNLLPVLFERSREFFNPQKLFCFPLALMNGDKVSEPEVLAILATLPQFLAE